MMMNANMDAGKNAYANLKDEDIFFRWIDTMNGGRGYVDVDGIMAQIGFDVRYDQWNFGLSVLLFQSLLSDEAKRANELYKAAFPRQYLAAG